ncbi:MAG: lysylphosphatidylglycerol synthase transmembrane domain-containing protein [Candidatus Dormibacteria bacterium]
MIPIGCGLAAIVALIIASNPFALGGAISRFDLLLIPAILGLSAAYYVLQGLRWYFLLRDVGSRIGIGDSILLNIAGQSTTMLPLGELSRAVFASEACPDLEFGEVVATVTVQELIMTLILIVIAVPGVLSIHRGLPVLIVALVGIAGAMAMLLVPPCFHFVHRLVERTPVLRRFTGQVDRLRQETVVLLQRPETLGWSVLSVAGAGASVTLFWLVVLGVGGDLSWPVTSFVLAASYVAGAISLIPGGIGASEASVIGLLVLVGVDPAAATAAALIQRVADKGFATLMGFIAYAIARRRFKLSGLTALRPGSGAPPVPASIEPAGMEPAGA